MRKLIKSLGYVFLGLLFIQLLTLPTYRTVKQRDPSIWPHQKGIISGTVAIRKHQGDIVKGFIISSDGLSARPFSAPENAFKGPAARQLKQFDRMTARRKNMGWSIPLNLILIFIGFWFSDYWEKKHPAPGHAMDALPTTPEGDYKNILSLKVEHAKLKRQQNQEDEEDPNG